MIISGEKKTFVLQDTSSTSQESDCSGRQAQAPSGHKARILPEKAHQKPEKIWKRPVVPETLRDPLGHTDKLANEELSKMLAPPQRDSTQQRIDLSFDYDARNNARAKYWVRIRDGEGFTLAEVWGTKNGKARTYRINAGRELNPLEEHQVALSLPIARRFVTGKPEDAHADDSAPESGSDTSDDE